MTFGAGGQRSNPLSYGRMAIPSGSLGSSADLTLRNPWLNDSHPSALAERAGFEPAEEREPLDGLANRCLGPLDYLSNIGILPLCQNLSNEELSTTCPGQRSEHNRPRWQNSPAAQRNALTSLAEGAGFEPARLLACRFSRPVVSTAHPPLRWREYTRPAAPAIYRRRYDRAMIPPPRSRSPS